MAAATAAIGAVTLGLGASPALAADPCPNAQFRTGASARLADCRAYEQVTPVNKDGNPAFLFFGQTRAYAGWSAADGNTALFNTGQGPGLPDSVRGFSFPQVSERTSGGWVSRPAANGPAPQAVIDAVSSLMTSQVPSADRKSLLFVSGAPFTPDNPASANTSGGVNIARGSAVEWISKPTWAGASPQPGAISPGSLSVVGASADLSTAFFVSRGTLTPEDGTSGRVAGDSYGLYRWSNGHLSNAAVLPDGISVDPDGAAMAGRALDASPTTNTSNNYASDMYGVAHSVSSDGKSWLFVSPDPTADTGRPSQLYLGQDGKRSVLLSAKIGQSAPVAGTTGIDRVGARNGIDVANSVSPDRPGTFAIRSRNGRFVVFTTEDALTDDAATDTTMKTYRLDLNKQTLTYLPELTFPRESNLAVVPLGPVLNMSDDGSRILYRDPVTSQLALWKDDGPPTVLSTTSGTIKDMASRFSTDGRTVVVTSTTALAGATDHPAGQAEIYRYTEAGGHLNCISCPPLTASPRGAASLSPLGQMSGSTEAGSLYAQEPTRGMTDDGKSVFFWTTSPLSPDDKNTVADVYQWTDGKYRLLSTGAADAKGAYLLDNDADGKNVFFVAAEGLVGQDVDGIYDMYVARVDGGFPAKVPEVQCVVGKDCQDGPLTAPTVATPASPGLAPVTVGPQKPLKNEERSTTLRVRKGKSSSSRVTVKVRTPGSGRIRARGRGLRTSNRKAKRSTTYTVRVKLTKHARSTLRKKGRLQVRVKVRFTPTHGKSISKTVKVTMKRHVRSSRKGR